MEYKYNISPERHIYRNEQKRSISKTRTNKNSLIKKKFKLSSAFDHKGSKHFLNSKKIALQQIILNDDNSIDDSDTANDTNEKTKETKKIRKYSCKRSLPNDEIKNHLKVALNVDQNKKKINKRSPEKMKSTSVNDLFKRMFASSTNNQHYLSKKNITSKKVVSHKFFSNQEIKMFEDKDIKKIKPIKKTNKEIKNENENENKNKNSKNIVDNVSFMERNDSSIIDIITQLK
jgi:hypothetical protein